MDIWIGFAVAALKAGVLGVVGDGIEQALVDQGIDLGSDQLKRYLEKVKRGLDQVLTDKSLKEMDVLDDQTAYIREEIKELLRSISLEEDLFRNCCYDAKSLAAVLYKKYKEQKKDFVEYESEIQKVLYVMSGKAISLEKERDGFTADSLVHIINSHEEQMELLRKIWGILDKSMKNNGIYLKKEPKQEQNRRRTNQTEEHSNLDKVKSRNICLGESYPLNGNKTQGDIQMYQEYEYDIALSFAGEDRKYAEELALKLRNRGVQVFYDNWNIASLWGENLYTYLAETYRDKALFCVTIISKKYCEKQWTKHELEFIQEREFQGEVYWLPLFLEEVKVPGLSETRGRVYANQHEIDEIVDILCEKINKRKYEIKINGLEKPKIMRLIGEDGTTEEVEVVFAFSFKDNNKEYVIYTKHEVDEEKNITVYVSNVERSSDGQAKLLGVSDEDEWERIKEVMRELAEVDSSYQPPKFDADGIEIL